MSAIKTSYSNGKPALKIAEDQTGFCYYPDGKVALCAASSSDYQNTHYCYDRNGALLLAIDALGIGYVQSSKRPAADLPKFSATFSSSGCVVSMNDVITREWIWANPKQSIQTEIKERLNESMVFTFEDREHIYLHFECDGHKFTADLSVKQKRKEPPYLATATRDRMGRLVLQNKSKTLKQRTEDFNKSMAFKNNLVHPKSENLSEMVSGIVAGLERKFGGIGENMLTSPSPGKTWKGDALDTTIAELPKISAAGTETGKFSGLGKVIYSTEDAATTKMSQTLPKHLLSDTGVWKNDTDVRASLQNINPVLKRTNVLKCNSGRYSNMLVVDPTRVTAQNPTGMVEMMGLPLTTVRWAAFKAELAEAAQVSSSAQTLTVAVIGRLGESRYGMCLRMAEQANLILQNSGNDATNPKFRLVSIEVGDDSSIIQDLNLRYMPTFAMWSGGHLAYLGQAGGKRVSQGPGHRPKVLLIESSYKFQLSIEKLLKKCSCDSFLCLNISAALDSAQALMTTEGPDNAFDLVLIAQDAIEEQAADLSMLRGKIVGDIESGRTVVAAMYDVIGGDKARQNLQQFSWDSDGLSEDVAKVPGGSRLFTRVAQKPMKAASIERLLGLRSYLRDDLYVQLGVTPESLISTMDKVREGVIKGERKDPSIFRELHLSVYDAQYKGVKITR